MSIIRVEKTKDYTIMCNHHLKEKEMSLKAKGLLSLMLSLPNDWDYSISGLCKICKENETAIKSTLDELKKIGYLQVIKKSPKETESGRIEYEYIIYEKKQDTEKQGVEFLGVENLGVEFLGVENQAQYNTNNKIPYGEKTNNKELNNNLCVSPKIQDIFDYWNACNIVQHRELTAERIKAITKALEKWDIDTIKEAIRRYSVIVNDKQYYFDTRWDIAVFMKQKNALPEFIDREDCATNKWVAYVSKTNHKQQNKSTSGFNDILSDLYNDFKE